VVRGIRFLIEHRTTTPAFGSDKIGPHFVRVWRGGAVVGDNRGNTVPIGDSDVVDAFGGLDDLWGTIWTPADVNDAGFGVSLKYKNVMPGVSADILVDRVQAQVAFDLPWITHLERLPGRYGVVRWAVYFQTDWLGEGRVQLPPLGTVNRIVIKPDSANPPDGPFDLRIVSSLDVDRTLGQVQSIDNAATSTHYPFIPGAAPNRHAPLVCAGRAN
jgi:hypothetical protein